MSDNGEGNQDTSDNGNGGLMKKIMMGVLIALVILLIIGGVGYATSEGETSQISEKKEGNKLSANSPNTSNSDE